MKITELPIYTPDEQSSENQYLICNQIIKNDDNEVKDINKGLISVNNFAKADAVNAIVEQNTQLVSIVTQLINKCNAMEQTLNEVKGRLNNTSVSDIEDLTQTIMDLKLRLDNDVIEY